MGYSDYDGAPYDTEDYGDDPGMEDRCAWCDRPLSLCQCLSSDVPPPGFDPSYAGERWDDDY